MSSDGQIIAEALERANRSTVEAINGLAEVLKGPEHEFEPEPSPGDVLLDQLQFLISHGHIVQIWKTDSIHAKVVPGDSFTANSLTTAIARLHKHFDPERN